MPTIKLSSPLTQMPPAQVADYSVSPINAWSQGGNQMDAGMQEATRALALAILKSRMQNTWQANPMAEPGGTDPGYIPWGG